MNIFQSFFLGIIQGLTEFLPVSSSGHLVLFQELLGIDYHDLAFDMVVHLATLLAVVVVFRKFLGGLIKEFFQYFKKAQFNSSLQFVLYVVVGTLPAGIIGVAFKDWFEQLFNSTFYVGIGFLFTGVILFMTRFKNNKGDLGHYDQALEDFGHFSYQKALIVGFAQAIAITPGISRSGMTIAAGLLVGLSGRAASVFSFCLAIPVILGAAVLMLKDTSFDMNLITVYGVGFISSFLSGVLALLLVIKIVKKRKLEYFSIYLWILGVVIILWKGFL